MKYLLAFLLTTSICQANPLVMTLCGQPVGAVISKDRQVMVVDFSAAPDYIIAEVLKAIDRAKEVDEWKIDESVGLICT